MTEAVLDASVVIKWFRRTDERNVEAARTLLTAFRSGELAISVPPLLFLEIVNVAGHRWGWQQNDLVELARALLDLEFQQQEPDLVGIAQWTSRGLTAYDASYVALAEAEKIPLVTDDDRIVALAPAVAVALSAAESRRR